MNALVPKSIRTLGKKRGSPFLDFKKRVEDNFLRSYTYFIIEGLERGFTKEDILSMKEHKDFFRLPLYWNTLLLKQKIKLKLFSWICLPLIPSLNFYFGMKQILEFYGNSEEKNWNPAYLKRDLCFTENDQLELEFHIIPSPYGFNWEKPRSFFFSLRNYLTPFWGHKIGHAFVVLKQNGSPVLATGMTGETNYQVLFKLLFKKGGFEFLFQSFRGRLEKATFVLNDIKIHKEKEKIQTLTFPLSLMQFQNCLDHLKVWTESGLYKNYGLPFCITPTKGASCTSFAVNFLQITGFLTEEHKLKWKRKVNIPQSLLKSQDNSVGAFRLAYNLLRRNRWVQKEHFNQLFFWDPDLIYNWIKSNSPPSAS